MLGMGLAFGLVVTLLVVRSVEQFLFDIDALDIQTLLSTMMLLGIATLMASYLPALRAARVDPVEVLREE